MRTPNLVQPINLQNTERKSSQGKLALSSRKLNNEQIQPTTERKIQMKKNDLFPVENLFNVDPVNKNNVLDVEKADTYLQILTGDAEIVQSQRTDKEEMISKNNIYSPENIISQNQNQLNQEQFNNDDVEDKFQVKDELQNQQLKQQPYLYYVYGGNYPETVVNALKERGNWQEAKEEDNIEKCNFLWRPFNYPADVYKRIDKRMVRNSSIFVYNHFEILKGLVTKSGQAGYSIFDSTPTTFLLASQVDDAEKQEMVNRYKDFQRGHAPKERIPIKHCVNNIWLVKPSNANQGKGIEIFSDLDDMLRFIHSKPQYTCCVVQKYVERPLLFKGRKFDIRVWALFNNKNEVFMYKHGYLRTSSDDYNLTNGNNYVHLTNNCLQKFGTNYGVHEEGNTVGFDVLQQFLDENYPQYNLNAYEHFVPRMRDLIIDSFQATRHQLNPNKRKHCFELLGYDFLIDEDFRLWLIEINTNPYFGVPNNFIANLLPKMMDDLLDLVLDPIYPPINKPENSKTPNDFELLYSDGNTSNSQNPVNLRRAFSTSLYPVPELAQQVGPKAPRQDLKYLRQFKIQNLALSTVSYKNTKDPIQKEKEDKNSAEYQNNHNPQSQNTSSNRARSSTIIKSQNSNNNSNNNNNNNYYAIQNLRSQTASNDLQSSRGVRSRSLYKLSNNNNNNNGLVMVNASEQNNITANDIKSQAIKQLPQTQNANTSTTKKSLNLKTTNSSPFNPKTQVQVNHNSRTPKFSSNNPKKSSIDTSINNQIIQEDQPLKSLKTNPQPKQNLISKQDDHKQQQQKDQQDELQDFNQDTQALNNEQKMIKLRDEPLVEEKKDLNESQIEKIFKTVIEKLSIDRSDQKQIIKSMELLKQIFENNKATKVQIEQFISELLQQAKAETENDQLNHQIVEFLIKYSDKPQSQQLILKNQNIIALVQIFTQSIDAILIKRVQSIFINLLQKKQNKKDQQHSKSMIISSKIQKEKDFYSQVSIYQQALEHGLLALIMASNPIEKLKEIFTQLDQNDIKVLLMQLKSITNQDYSQNPYQDDNNNNKQINQIDATNKTDVEVKTSIHQFSSIHFSPRLESQTLNCTQIKVDQNQILDKIQEHLQKKDLKDLIQRLEKIEVNLNSKSQGTVKLFNPTKSQNRLSTKNIIALSNYNNKRETSSNRMKQQYQQQASQMMSPSKYRGQESPFKRALQKSQIAIRQSSLIVQNRQYQTIEAKEGLAISANNIDKYQQITPKKESEKSNRPFNGQIISQKNSNNPQLIQNQYQIQQNLNGSVNAMNSSQFSNSKNMINQSEDEVLSKIADKSQNQKNGKKFAPILQNKQRIASYLQLYDQQNDQKAIKSSSTSTNFSQNKRQIQSAKLSKNQYQRTAAYTNPNKSHTKDKRESNQFSVIHKNQSAIKLTVDDISILNEEEKINRQLSDIQTQLSILQQQQYSGSKTVAFPDQGQAVQSLSESNLSPNKIIVETIYLNTSESNQNNNSQTYILPNQTNASDDFNYKSITRNGEDSHNNQIIQKLESNESKVNVDLVPNIQYFKRGVQVRQSMKKPKVQQLNHQIDIETRNRAYNDQQQQQQLTSNSNKTSYDQQQQKYKIVQSPFTKVQNDFQINNVNYQRKFISEDQSLRVRVQRATQDQEV